MSRYVKKYLIIILLIIIGCITCSCSFSSNDNDTYNLYFENNWKWANKKVDLIYSAIRDKDKNTLMSTFSSNALKNSPDLDTDIDTLFELFDADIVDCDIQEAVTISDSSGQGRKYKYISYKFYFFTDNEKYFCYIKECVYDKYDSENIGIATIKITNVTYDEYVYTRGVKDDDPLGLIITETEATPVETSNNATTSPATTK